MPKQIFIPIFFGLAFVLIPVTIVATEYFNLSTRPMTTPAWYAAGIQFTVGLIILFFSIAHIVRYQKMTAIEHQEASVADNYEPVEPGVLSQLPDDLKYLIPPALAYGKYQFDADVDDFLDSATPQQMKELETTARRVLAEGAYKRVLAWLNDYEITDYPEAACLYFLFGVMDAADYKFD